MGRAIFFNSQSESNMSSKSKSVLRVSFVNLTAEQQFFVTYSSLILLSRVIIWSCTLFSVNADILPVGEMTQTTAIKTYAFTSSQIVWSAARVFQIISFFFCSRLLKESCWLTNFLLHYWKVSASFLLILDHIQLWIGEESFVRSQ